MQFNDVAGGQGICQDIDFLANSDPTTYLIADKVRNVNNWIDICIGLIMASDGRWEWDDPNQVDLPSATAQLNNGQQQYNFDSSWLDVKRVDILDQNGNWNVLNPLEQSDIKGVGLASFQSTAGNPNSFWVEGENIFLSPAPNYTLAAAMRIYFQRKPVYVTTASTTTLPAFVSIYHRILSYGAASDWALTKDQNRYNKLLAAVGVKNPATGKYSGMLGDLQGHYASRNKYERARIVPGRRIGKWDDDAGVVSDLW